MDDREVINIVSFILRLGSGLSLFYLGLLKTLSPVAQGIWLDWMKATPALSSTAVIWLNITLYIELLGGLALITGLFTRYAAGVTSALLLVQLLFLNWYAPQALLGPWGPYMIKDVALLAATLSITLLGAPSWSIDGLFGEL
jgi:uncharacterized membrane protein YphA (DoxX/SURF4 family)